MLDHDHFRGLCELASESQASPEDLASLLSHIMECEPCREAYERSLLATEEHADKRVIIPELDHNDGYRKRFLARARPRASDSQVRWKRRNPRRQELIHPCGSSNTSLEQPRCS